VTGGYIAFFRPDLLSKNIEHLQKRADQWGWFLAFTLVVFGSYLLFYYTESFTEISYYIFCWLLLLGFTDAYSRIIPNRLLYLGLVFWLILLLTGDSEIVTVAPAVLIALLLSTIRFGSQKIWGKPGFGWGDIKLILVLGLLTGWNIFWILYIAIISGAFFSLFKILDKKNNYSTVSFAPHIVMGYLLIEAYQIYEFILPLIYW